MTKIIIYNVGTGEIIEREMSKEEIERERQQVAEMATLEKKQALEQAAKDAARQAVLDKLGLTADEVAALLG